MSESPQDSMSWLPQKKSPLLRNRDFMLLWCGQSVSEIGSGITLLAIPLVAVVVLNVSTFEVALLSAVSMLPFLLVSLPAGVVVDRVAKRTLMLWCDIGRLVLVSSIPLVTIPGAGLHLTYIHLVVVALLTGILTVFFDIAYQSYLPVLLDAEELIEGNGKLGTTSSFAQFAAPSLGGGLIALLGAARAIALDAASFAISALSLFLIRTPEAAPEPRVESRKMRHEIAEGFAFVVKHPILRHVVACTGVSNFFTSMGFALEMVFLVRVLDVPPGLVGLVFSTVAVGGMVGGLMAGRLGAWFGTARVIWLSILVLQLPMFLAPLATPGWGVLLYAGGFFFSMAAGVVYNVAQVSYRQAITPPEMMGRMNASVRFLVWGTLPLGATLGGVLGSSLGIRETLWIALVGAWCAGLFVFFSPLRTMRDYETHETYAARPSNTRSDPEPLPSAG